MDFLVVYWMITGVNEWIPNLTLVVPTLNYEEWRKKSHCCRYLRRFDHFCLLIVSKSLLFTKV